VPQLMGGVADDPVGVGSGVTLGELQVPAPHGITEEAAPLAIDESAVQPAVAALTARRVAVDQAADRGHGDVGDHDSALGRAGLQVLTYVPAPAGLTGGAVDLHALPVEADDGTIVNHRVHGEWVVSFRPIGDDPSRRRTYTNPDAVVRAIIERQHNTD
jgi:hypothetical protein